MIKTTMCRLTSLAVVLALLAAPLEAQTPVVEYVHLDAVGSVRAVTDQAGNLVERHDFLPFGEEWCETGPCAGVAAGQSRRYTGQERDSETGLDYFGARHYASAVGRFGSIDPLMETQKNLLEPQRWNRYAYALNNPLRYCDPNGQSPTVVTAAVGAGIGYAFAWAGSVVSQRIRTGSFSNVNYDDARIAGVGGAISGGLAGLTFGLLPALEATAAGVIAVSGATNVVGGAVVREVDAYPGTNATDLDAAAFDFGAGVAGGVAGLKVRGSYATEISELDRIADDMLSQARRGNSWAWRRRNAMLNRTDDLEAAAGRLELITGSKMSDFAAPVVEEAVSAEEDH